MIGTISLLLIVMWVLFMFSIESDNDMFTFIGSCGLLLLSVYIMVNGLEGVNNWVTRSFALVQIGIGTIGLFAPVYKFVSGDVEEVNSDE